MTPVITDPERFDFGLYCSKCGWAAALGKKPEDVCAELDARGTQCDGVLELSVYTDEIRLKQETSESSNPAPAITDPERFDVECPDDPFRLRIHRDPVSIVISQTGPYAEITLGVDQLRWLRDRFNEILGEVPK